MKKMYVFLSILAVVTLVIPTSVVHADDNGVDDLRGRWDVEWVLEGDEGNPPPPLILYINDIVENPYSPSMYLAGGCMRSPDTDVFMPLSLAAIPDPDHETYEVTIYSTVVPGELEPFVIRLTGTVVVHGKGVPDDVAGGEVTTEFATGQWSGTHHDRRRTKCPSVGYGHFVQADVRVAKDLAYDPPMNTLVLELYTVIVSTVMQVEMPDGSTRIVEQYTDIFSPQVDFVGRFRYFGYFEGEQPVAGEPYTFILLDVVGNPIQGTESTDVFSRCTQDAPRNLTASEAFEEDVSLSWDPVPEILGEFEPDIQVPDSEFHLPYQVNVGSAKGGLSSEFGSLGQDTNHIIPWNDFEPGGPGLPDGFNFGQSLSSFEDGLYQISLDSWNMPVLDQGGHYQDCEVHDSSDILFMQKSEGRLTFTPSSTISGVVVSESGEPIADIWVDACEYDNEGDPYCRSGLTNAEGKYRITGLLPGDYRVQTGGDGWTREYFNDTRFWDQASRVETFGGSDTGGIDFTLERAGSISGTVYDDQGEPVANIGVDIEEGDFGACTDENGNYTLEGLPFGTYNVVAGRDFCDPHPYAEQTIFDITIDLDAPNANSVDFHLSVGGPPPSNFNVIAQPDHGWVASDGWEVGTVITLTIDGQEWIETAAPADWDPNVGTVWFDWEDWGEFDLMPDMTVTVTDGSVTETLLVESHSVDSFDQGTGLVSGTVPESPSGRDVGVGLHGPGIELWQVVQADPSGHWEADFSAESVDFSLVEDIHTLIWDADGDATQANYNFPPE